MSRMYSCIVIEGGSSSTVGISCRYGFEVLSTNLRVLVGLGSSIMLVGTSLEAYNPFRN